MFGLSAKGSPVSWPERAHRLGMRFGPDGRILHWRRIRVHSAGRYGHEAPVGRLGARASATEHARFHRTTI